MDLSLLLNNELQTALMHSFGLSLLLLLLALPLARRLPRLRPSSRALLLALCALPLLVPLKLTALLDQAIAQLPAVLLPLYLGMRHFETGLSEAAASLGLGAGVRLRHILLPQYGLPIVIALLLGTLYGLSLQPVAATLPSALLAGSGLLLLFILLRRVEAMR